MKNQDRMMAGKWGIFNHYLYYSEKGYSLETVMNDKENIYFL